MELLWVFYFTLKMPFIACCATSGFLINDRMQQQIWVAYAAHKAGPSLEMGFTIHMQSQFYIHIHLQIIFLPSFLSWQPKNYCVIVTHFFFVCDIKVWYCQKYWKLNISVFCCSHGNVQLYSQFLWDVTFGKWGNPKIQCSSAAGEHGLLQNNSLIGSYWELCARTMDLFSSCFVCYVISRTPPRHVFSVSHWSCCSGSKVYCSLRIQPTYSAIYEHMLHGLSNSHGCLPNPDHGIECQHGFKNKVNFRVRQYKCSHWWSKFLPFLAVLICM